MRTTVVGLVALPVILGGIGLAAAAVYYSGNPSFNADAPATQTHSRDAHSGDDEETSIAGRRPYLTVHEGSRLLAGSLTGLNSVRPIPLPPLAAGSPTLRSATSPATPTRETTAPAAAGPTWSAEVAIPQRQINSAPTVHATPHATAHATVGVSGGLHPTPPALEQPDPRVGQQPTVAAPPVAVADENRSTAPGPEVGGHREVGPDTATPR